MEIVSLLPDADDYNATRSADATGSEVASIGRPRLGLHARREYIEALSADRKRIDAEGGSKKLITWTINDENELRELIAIGVDGDRDRRAREAQGIADEARARRLRPRGDLRG